MTANTYEPEARGAAEQKPKSNVRKALKILMIHGYTQSGPLFRSKTRALEKLLAKALAPLSLELSCHYPTAPIKLNPRDIPGYTPPADVDDEQSGAADPDTDSWAWFRKRDDPTAPGGIAYVGFEQGVSTLASAIREAGGDIDGVLGFSQGGAMAALVASVLETPHRDVPAESASWAAELRDANGGKGLKFAAVYSGFFATVDNLSWCYEPKIQTPTIQFIGSLDTVVEESRSQALIERSENPTVVIHPGGHYVPISKEWAMALAGFVKQQAQAQEQRPEANL